ncbi:MAG: hypothetical protein WDA65_09295 [Christensenellales bacterium]
MHTNVITGTLKECMNYMYWRMTEMRTCLSMDTELVCDDSVQPNSYVLTLRCPAKYKDILTIELSNLIAESVSFSFKRRFFEEKLRLRHLGGSLSSALMTAYSLFDREAERRYFHSIRLGETVDIDGIYNCLLGGLKSDWLKECDLFSRYTVGSEAYALHLIKHMRGEAANILPYVSIEREGECNIMRDMYGKKIAMPDTDALSLLVWLNPHSVEIMPGAVSDAGLGYARQIFAAG